MGGGDINDNNVLLDFTVDIKVILFSLTHAVLSLTWFVNCLHNMYFAVLYLLFI